jgi:hypothetical protein
MPALARELSPEVAVFVGAVDVTDVLFAVVEIVELEVVVEGLG